MKTKYLGWKRKYPNKPHSISLSYNQIVALCTAIELINKNLPFLSYSIINWDDLTEVHKKLRRYKND